MYVLKTHDLSRASLINFMTKEAPKLVLLPTPSVVQISRRSVLVDGTEKAASKRCDVGLGWV